MLLNGRMNKSHNSFRTLLTGLLGVSLITSFTGCTIQYTSSSGSSRSFTTTRVSKGPPRLVLNGDDVTQGSWETDLENTQSAKEGRLVHLELHEQRSVRSLAWKEIPGFPRAGESSSEPKPVIFELSSAGGTLHFSGMLENEKAEGRYTFNPNADYAKGAGELLDRQLANADLLELGLADVTLEYIREVQNTGLKAGYSDILSLKRHGLQPATIRSYVELGFNASELVRLKTQGVSPEFVKEVRAQGFGKAPDELIKIRNQAISADYIANWRKVEPEISLDEMIKLRNQAVTPEYVVSWRKVDPAMDHDEMIRLRNQALTPEQVVAWKKTGYELSYSDMIRARNQALTPEFATAARETGYSVTLDDLIRMRQQGITPEYYRAMKKVNSALTTEELVRYRQHGVTPEYVEGLGKAGYDFTPEQIVKLRNSGVTVDYVAALKVPGRNNLDVATIIDLRNRGVSAETARKLRE